MTKKFELAFVCLFCAFISAFGQGDYRDGYIINIDNDTIQGQVVYRSNSKNYQSCIFKNADGEKEYLPNQIDGFGYASDKYFSSRILKGSFVEVLISGKISLYKSEESFIIQKDTVILTLEPSTEEVIIDGKTKLKENNQWKGFLNYFISDCLSSNSVSNVEYHEKSLTKLISKYNECSGYDYIEYKADKPWTRFEMEAALGLSRTQIKLDNIVNDFYYLDDLYNSLDPSLGISLVFSSPRISERLALNGEIQYMKSSFTSLVEIDEIFIYESFINIQTLSIPFSLKYSFPEKRIGFYLQAGVNYDFNFNSNTRLTGERVSGNVVNVFPERIAFTINNNQIGYWGGIGVFKSYQKFRTGLSLRYLHMYQLNQTPGFSAINDRISVYIILTKK